MKNRLFQMAMLTLTGGLLMACGGVYQEPVVVDISDSKVVVQRSHSVGLQPNTATVADVQKVANKSCNLYSDKSSAIALSQRCGAQVQGTFGPICTATDHLFACKDRK